MTMKDYYVVEMMENGENSLIDIGLMRYSEQKEEVNPEAERVQRAFAGMGAPQAVQEAMGSLMGVAKQVKHRNAKPFDMYISVPKSMLKEITVGSIVSVTIAPEDPPQ